MQDLFKGLSKNLGGLGKTLKGLKGLPGSDLAWTTIDAISGLFQGLNKASKIMKMPMGPMGTKALKLAREQKIELRRIAEQLKNV